jgi:hypothetical protein
MRQRQVHIITLTAACQYLTATVFLFPKAFFVGEGAAGRVYPHANRHRIHPRARRRIFGISMCAQQREVCKKFRKLKMRKKTGLCLGFFSLNETPQKGFSYCFSDMAFHLPQGKGRKGIDPLSRGFTPQTYTPSSAG